MERTHLLPLHVVFGVTNLRCTTSNRVPGLTTKGAKLILYSNSRLTSALSLYKSYGFQDVDLKDSPFVTADVKMELML